jgi:hypothetical protein
MSRGIDGVRRHPASRGILRIGRLNTFVCMLLVSSIALAQPTDRDRPAANEALQMARAAAAFLDGLTEMQRAQAVYAFTGPNRTNWSNVPMFVHPRPGVRVGELDEQQRRAAQALLRASLSSQGYQKVAGIMRLDSIHGAMELEQLEREGPPEDARPFHREEAESFGAGSYGIAILGEPAPDASWGWILQGHHLAASFTVASGRVAFTPLFLGATPLVLEHGIDAGWSALPHEAGRGFELMAALSDAQRTIATESGDVPGDVIYGVGNKDRLPQPAGLKASDMTEEQQRLLRMLVEEYIRNASNAVAQLQLDAIAQSGWDRLWFAWRGATGNASAALYYRVQGPRIFIELSQRPNHVHTIVRDPLNDYGENWLGETLTEEHTANDRFETATRAYESAESY